VKGDLAERIQNRGGGGSPGSRAEWWRSDFSAHGSYEPEVTAGARMGVQDSPLPFWALMAFTCILLLSPQRFLPLLSTLRIALAAAAIAAAAYLFDRLLQRRPISLVTREMWLTASLFAWAILTLPLSYWPGGSATFLYDVYFKSLLIFWLLSNTVNTVARMRQIFWVLTLMSIPLGATAVENFLSGTFLPQGDKRIIGYEAPLTRNPNDLALMLNLILPLSVALFGIHRKLWIRVLLATAMLASVGAVIVTFSRSGFVTLVAISVLYLWRLLRGSRSGSALMMLVLVLLSVPFFPSGYLERVGTIPDIESDPTGSSQQRWNDMVAAASFVLRNPIVGAGVGMNILALNEERGPLWLEVHNVYLQFAVELGLPGLILFVLLLLSCLKGAGLVEQQSATMPALREFFCLAAAIRVSLIGFTVAAFFYPVGYQFYFYYFAGLTVALKALYGAEARGDAV